MKTPLVSVFIPLYNAEEYIEETIASILAQSYINLEIVIVNDGSKDRSREIVNSIKDNRIRLMDNEKNMGLPYTRNVGLREAKGKYLAILDADDLAHKDRLRDQVYYLEKFPDCKAVVTDYKEFGRKFNRRRKIPYNSNEELRISLLFKNRIGNSTGMIRVRDLKDEYEYNPKYFVLQDYEFWSRLAYKNEIGIIHKTLTFYRTGHVNITKKSLTERFEKRRKLLQEIHVDSFNRYKFILSKEEQEIFTSIFNPDTHEDYGSYNRLLSVLENLINQNKKKKITSTNVFERVCKEELLDSIANSKLRFIEISSLFKKVSNTLFEISLKQKLKVYLILSAKKLIRKY
ncbi:glycosyltransferase family 2 protein [Terribacillus saccharophilus]|uniref:Glycosyltransferase 2-like domain-containing protein n=1 Tax=Terribacillus saccharophilus TaxID=361277 RepID=A0ABX4GXP6_9BACI|nr:glycosyltransferase family 2 protein [Terribacillus saccharophilus]PAD35118.1 hypothetical protein CHH56_11060 [Terribacillus saccharophilus]PAD96023.1 hypothetical protein CHH50_11245 [Terribacillus saccharophilus]PAD99653.1 hypothetical protein CHH48_10390 [Terribacillus saccharophilus]